MSFDLRKPSYDDDAFDECEPGCPICAAERHQLIEWQVWLGLLAMGSVSVFLGVAAAALFVRVLAHV